MHRDIGRNHLQASKSLCRVSQRPCASPNSSLDFFAGPQKGRRHCVSTVSSLAILSQIVILHTLLQTTWRGLDFIDEKVEAFQVQVLPRQLASLGPRVYLAEVHLSG